MRSKTLNSLKILFGSVIYAAGFRLFLYPNEIVPGGLTGIGMIFNHLINVPVGVAVIILNVPIFAIAWRVIGRWFFIGSLAGAVLSSVAIDVIGLLSEGVTREPLLGSVYGGLVCGLGLGLVFLAGASTGGSDVLAKLLKRKYDYMNLGRVMLMVDFAVIALGALVLRSYDSAMYAVISVFISSKIIDGVLYGFEFSKVCYIVSNREPELSRAISERLGRGATLLYGRGAYTGREKMVLMCAIKRQQIVDLKKIVGEIDENAFIIISEAREVLGYGFTREEEII